MADRRYGDYGDKPERTILWWVLLPVVFPIVVWWLIDNGVLPIF